MSKSALSQTRGFFKRLIPCRLTGRTPDFESGNSGSKPDEGTKRDLYTEIMAGFGELKMKRETQELFEELCGLIEDMRPAKAIALYPLHTYVLQTDMILPTKTKERILATLEIQHRGIKFLLLDGGLKIATEK